MHSTCNYSHAVVVMTWQHNKSGGGRRTWVHVDALSTPGRRHRCVITSGTHCLCRQSSIIWYRRKLGGKRAYRSTHWSLQRRCSCGFVWCLASEPRNRMSSPHDGLCRLWQTPITPIVLISSLCVVAVRRYCLGQGSPWTFYKTLRRGGGVDLFCMYTVPCLSSFFLHRCLIHVIVLYTSPSISLIYIRCYRRLSTVNSCCSFSSSSEDYYITPADPNRDVDVRSRVAQIFKSDRR